MREYEFSLTRILLHTGEYGSVKTRIFAYFIQCLAIIITNGPRKADFRIGKLSVKAPFLSSSLSVTRENNYNLKNFQELQSSFKQTVKFRTETISYKGPQIWNLISERLRELETLNKLKKKNGIVMSVHVECAKHTFDMLASLTKKL